MDKLFFQKEIFAKIKFSSSLRANTKSAKAKNFQFMGPNQFQQNQESKLLDALARF